MGSITVPRRSSLTAPTHPDRARPPAGAFLYCQPREGAITVPALPLEELRLPGPPPPQARPDAA